MSDVVDLNFNEQEHRRLDAFLTDMLEGVTRSHIKNLIDEGNVSINDTPAKKPGVKLKNGDRINVIINESEIPQITPENIPLDIIYEDDDIAVINKPRGMVTHPAPGNYRGTLVNAAMYHFKSLSDNAADALRPGIVHRLDKDTSGLIIIAKSNAAQAQLSRQLSAREVKKKYIALLHGNVKEDNGTISTNIDRHPKDRKKMAVTRTGREAISKYKVLERFGKYTLTEFVIETGRTHQIRVHAKHIGHPVVGDPVYTNLKDPFKLNGQLLHAENLAFIHPITGEYVEFTAPLPDYFENVLAKLRLQADNS